MAPDVEFNPELAAGPKWRRRMWITEVLKWVGGGLSIGAILSLYSAVDDAAKPTELQKKVLYEVAENSAVIVQKMENNRDRSAQYQAAMGSPEWQNIQTLARRVTVIPDPGFRAFEKTFREAFQTYAQNEKCDYSAILDGVQWCVDYASRGASRWLRVADPHTCTIKHATEIRKDCGLDQQPAAQ
jgi:hypothetical protein